MNMRIGVGVMLAVVGALACRPGDILDVPPPSGEFTSKAIQGRTAVLQAFYGARSELSSAIGQTDGVVELGALLTDEMGGRNSANSSTILGDGAVDARYVRNDELSQSGENSGDQTLVNLAGARSSLVLAETGLQQYAAATDPAMIGEAYALIGYAELLLAEDYCAGMPLSHALPNGGWSFGAPLSQDTLLKAAETDFDSALAHVEVNGIVNDTVQGLASVGLGRTLLDRDSLTAAAAAVSGVPTAFVYNTQLGTFYQNSFGAKDNLYDFAFERTCIDWAMSDREGENGLNFISAVDPRLVVDSSISKTGDGCNHFRDSLVYYPEKFGEPASGLIPLASGLEARLIAAEAAIAVSDPSWLADLNVLRTGGCRHAEVSDTSCTYGTGQVPAQPSGLQPLTDPGTDSARVGMLFNERAFWLYGTGTRLGDLRRQARQYARYWTTTDAVFPTGPYWTGPLAGFQKTITNYGTDVAFSLPTALSTFTTTNPNYQGCLISTAAP